MATNWWEEFWKNFGNMGDAGHIGDNVQNRGISGKNSAPPVGPHSPRTFATSGTRNDVAQVSRSGLAGNGMPSTGTRKRPGGGGTWDPLPAPIQRRESPQGTGPRDLLSALSEAFGLVGGGNNMVSYDPLRQDARNRASEYDARIAAMYDQLVGSIRDDAAGIQENFQGAMDSTAERSEDIQGKVQAAHDAAQERNLQQAQALGIEEAMGNIMSRGQDINTQAASRVSDVAERGQITSDRLERGKQASLAHNTNLAGAAGLEGNLQRSRIGNELSSLLAQYDMEEQAANQQARQNSFMQALGLAQALVEDDRYRQNYSDSLEQRLFENELAQRQLALEGMSPDPMSMATNFIAQLTQNPLFSDLDLEELVKLIGAASSVGKIYS